MPRIYFDTNVFSNLKSATKEEYRLMNEMIKAFTLNLSFVFSPAHIRDKKKDKSDKKFKDFAFIESIAGDNYISYDAIEKKTSFYLATPRMAFDDNVTGSDLSDLENFWELDSEDERINEMKRELKEKYSKIPVIMPAIKKESMPEKQLIFSEKLFPAGKENISMFDVMEQLTKFSSEMYTDFKTYKNLRNYIDENFNQGKFSVHGELNFNEAFKDSKFKQSFTDFVYEKMQKDNNDNISFYDFFSQCFLSLDIFAIAKDEISKKNDFGNILNDSMHAWYGQFCDYFVTVDRKLREKTQALYRLFGINTPIVNPEKFSQLLPEIGKNSEKNIIQFFAKLWDEEKRADASSSVIEIKYPVVNFFDEIIVLQQTEKYFYLHKKQVHDLSQPNYRETAQIVGRCLRIFGTDLSKKEGFDFEKEVKQLRNKEWNGRIWSAGPLFIVLNYNHDIGELFLTVGPMRA